MDIVIAVVIALFFSPAEIPSSLGIKVLIVEDLCVLSGMALKNRGVFAQKYWVIPDMARVEVYQAFTPNDGSAEKGGQTAFLLRSDEIFHNARDALS